MKSPGVYSIRNKANGKLYVGSSSICVFGRWRIHRKELRGGYHANRHLQSAWNKYGEAAFAFEILEYCEPNDCIAREQHWIDELNAANDNRGYNILPNAGSSRGRTYDAEQRLQMSLVKRGTKHSEETRARMSASQKARQTPELRERQSKSRRGKPHHESWRKNITASLRSPAVREKLSVANRRPCSDEKRAKISASNRGKPVSTDKREKIAATLRGRRLSEEHKASIAATLGTPEAREKMRILKLGTKRSEEAKRKTSEAIKQWWQRKRLQLEARA